MEQFVVSARKYRPKSFDELIDQENIAQTLRNSIISGQLAHAYLFCGPRGVGKTSAARIFAKSINCLNPSKDMEPCGQCESCISFQEGRSYSIHELDAASNNSVDDIRNLNDMVRIPPQIGKYSVYIIDEVHMLSSAAFNAFLKTLEEPPEYAIFILATTEKHKILPTILSRCQTYDFNRISVNGIVKNLKKIAKEEGVNIDEDAMHIIGQKASGAMRDALTLFDQTVSFCGKEITYEQVIKNLNVLDYTYYFKITQAFMDHNHTEALIIFNELLSKGFDALHFISGLSSHFRDLIVCKNDASKSLMSLPPSITKQYEDFSKNCTLKFLFNALKETTKCEVLYKSSGNQRLLIEFTLMKLALLDSDFNKKPETQPIVNTIKPIENSKSVAAETPKEKPVEPITVKPEPEQPIDIKPETEPTTVKQETEPVPETKYTRRRITKSIKEMMQDAETADQKANEKYDPKNDIEFDLEKANKAWKEFSEIMIQEKKVVLGKTMLHHPLILEDHNKIVFEIDNIAQKKWIEEKCLTRMNSFMREKLSNNSMIVETKIHARNQKDKKVLYTQTEKAKHILSQNPEMKELKEALDLDIK
ncbi:MAG: DNA polymerase III subunit gamma/tau [Bacteroidales bacterium]